MLAALCLVLSWPAGPQAEAIREPELRALAFELAGGCDEAGFAARWAAAGAAQRELLIAATSRAFPGAPLLATAGLAALEDSAAAVRLAGVEASLAAPLDPELDEALFAALERAPAGSPEFEAAARALFRRGVLPEERFAARWKGLPEPARVAVEQIAARAAARGERPRRHFAPSLRMFPGCRDGLLRGAAGRLALPGPDAALLAELEELDATPFAAVARRVLILDSSPAEPGRWAAELWSAWLRGDLQEEEEEQALLYDAVLRHAPSLSAADFGAALAEWAPNDGVAESDLHRMLLRLPLALTQTRLRELAFDAGRPARQRAEAALYLLRGAGETAALEMRPLLENAQPQELHDALLAGMKPYADASLLPLLRARFSHFQGQTAAFALEILVAHCDHRERLEWLGKLAALPAGFRPLVVQEAWHADPHPDLVELFWGWTEAAQDDVQAVARQALAEALSAAEVAAGYRARLIEETDPVVRERLIDGLRSLRSDAALAVFCDWLASAEGRGHPRSASHAALVVTEAAALPLFRDWWQQPQGLSEAQLDLAAAALAGENPAARERLHQRFARIDPRNHHLVMLRLSANSGSREWHWWVELAGDRRQDPSLRRAAALGLVKALPGSGGAAEELLLRMERESAEGTLPDAPYVLLVEGCIENGDAGLRAMTVELCRRVEQRLGTEDGGLRGARLSAMGEAPRPEETAELLEEVVVDLAATTPEPAPPDREPDAAGMRLAHGRFALAVLALAAAADGGTDQELAGDLAEPGLAQVWHPDRLWLIGFLAPERLPLATAAARRLLDACEPPFSKRRPGSEAPAGGTGLPALLWTDAEQVQKLLADRLLGKELPEDHARLLQTALLRWPADRRFYNYAGWFALAAGDPKAAGRHFQAALRRSGTLPVTTLEPRLGWAVVNQLSAPGAAHLADFLAREPQARTLLEARLPVGLNPELAKLLPAVAPGGGQR